MKEQLKKIGLFGGTFDPVHIGHIIIAELVAESINLDSVVFIPSARPPHKGSNDIMFTAEERLYLLSLATDNNPRFSVSDIELRREGPSYTIDTIRQMKASLPPSSEICFIVGIDNLYEMKYWKAPKEILEECRLIAAKRVCDSTGIIPAWVLERVEIVDVPLIGVSSTDIRQRIRSGQSIRYQVPDPVYDAIMNNRASESG